MKTTPYHAGKHLRADELEPPAGRCPSCGSRAERRAVHRIQDDPVVDLLTCPECGISSASRMPTSGALEEYYGAYYGADDGDQVTFSGVERFARHIARFCPDGANKILDFGGGDGAVALALARILAGRGATPEVTLVDYAEPQPDAAFPIERITELEDVRGEFDVIVASAILEHVPDVGDAIRRLWRLGRPGAVFYARTPYWAPMLRLAPSIDLTFPGHVHDMGPAFWNRFIGTLELEGDLLASRPSIVETSLSQAPARTAAAYLLKAPSHLECLVRRGDWRRPLWGFVGGWEVFARVG